MEPLTSVVAVIGLFLLRLGIPLAITLILAYLLKRLDARWEVEARAEQQAQRLAETTSKQPAPQPWITPLPTALDVFGKPCWDIKNCDTAIRAACPAFANQEVPCWMARRQVEGRIPKECYHCELFAAIKPPAPGQQPQPNLYH